MMRLGCMRWILLGSWRMSIWRKALSISFLLILLCAPAVLTLAESRAVVTVPVANMYSSASEDVDVVSQAILGNDVEVLEESPGWEKVRSNDQYVGWMPLQDLRRVGPDDSGYAV